MGIKRLIRCEIKRFGNFDSMKTLECLLYKLCHFGRATREFIITICISFLPVFMGAGLAWLWSGSEFIQALYSNFKTGEAFLYSSAFLVPYVHKKLLEAKSTISSVIIFILSLYSFFIGAFVFSFVRLEGIISRKMNVSSENISTIGYTIIISTIIVWYYSVWKDHEKVGNIFDINQKNQEAFSEGLKNRLGGTENE